MGSLGNLGGILENFPILLPKVPPTGPKFRFRPRRIFWSNPHLLIRKKSPILTSSKFCLVHEARRARLRRGLKKKGSSRNLWNPNSVEQRVLWNSECSMIKIKIRGTLLSRSKIISNKTNPSFISQVWDIYCFNLGYLLFQFYFSQDYL